MKTKKGRIRLCALVLSVVLTACAAPALAKARQAVVTAKALTVYAKPKASSQAMGTVKKGETVNVAAVSGGIARILYKSGVGYVKKSGLKLESAKKAAPQAQAAEEATPAPGKMRTLKADAKLFRRANRSSKALMSLSAGQNVEVLKLGSRFARVKVGGTKGYVAVSAFKSAKRKVVAAPARPANSVKADKVISAAMAQLGKPYVYGSTGPSSFDCSGLTRYAYAQVGVSLPHSAQSVGYSAGKKVSRNELQKGDIACFNTVSDGDQSDHVGVYMGSSQFVHASSGQGRVVVSTMSGYYDERFSWGRRVF